MKKFILSLTIGLSALIAGNTASAQNYKFDSDTVRQSISGTSAMIYNDITNLSLADLTLRWRVIYQNIPSDWASGGGICDNKTCYASSIFNTSDTSWKTTMPVSGSSKMGFDVTLDVGSITTNGGPYYITVQFDDGSTKKIGTFELNKFPTGVKAVAKGENVTVYPNPASNELNVLFTSSEVRTVAIYNLIGNPVTAVKVSGNSAKLSIGSIPSGIYFVRLLDANGSVTATRKFTHL